MVSDRFHVDIGPPEDSPILGAQYTFRQKIVKIDAVAGFTSALSRILPAQFLKRRGCSYSREAPPLRLRAYAPGNRGRRKFQAMITLGRANMCDVIFTHINGGKLGGSKSIRRALKKDRPKKYHSALSPSDLPELREHPFLIRCGTNVT
jgi:hypothetical protein